MAQTVKLLSTAVITLSATANNINTAKVAFITNSNTTTSALLTVANSTGSNTGQMVLPPLAQIGVLKLPTDTIISNLVAGVFATSVAYTN